ncbi:MAG: hypothetical protein AAGI34_06015 [Pseudomonadota bacterium]
MLHQRLTEHVPTVGVNSGQKKAAQTAACTTHNFPAEPYALALLAGQATCSPAFANDTFEHRAEAVAAILATWLDPVEKAIVAEAGLRLGLTGSPLPTFHNIEAEAREWAEGASDVERAAYAFAALRCLPSNRREAAARWAAQVEEVAA